MALVSGLQEGKLGNKKCDQLQVKTALQTSSCLDNRLKKENKTHVVHALRELHDPINKENVFIIIIYLCFFVFTVKFFLSTLSSFSRHFSHDPRVDSSMVVTHKTQPAHVSFFKFSNFHFSLSSLCVINLWLWKLKSIVTRSILSLLFLLNCLSFSLYSSLFLSLSRSGKEEKGKNL